MTDPAPRLVDTHCHLMLAEFEGDLPEVLERARLAGVTRLVIPGIDLQTSRQAVDLCRQQAGLYAAVGIHPHSALEWSDSARSQLQELAAQPSVVAIGEIGLDYYRDRAPRPAQRRALAGQLELAAEIGLPVIIHNREATGDVLAALGDWARSTGQALSGRPGVMHAFSGDAAAAAEAVGAGFYLGLAGPLTYRRADGLRSVAAAVPRGQLVVETDSPYLPPHPYRGRRNEPSYLRLVAEAAARLWQTDWQDIAATTSQNAETLFGLAHASDRNIL